MSDDRDSQPALRPQPSILGHGGRQLGWIGAERLDREHLESLGIELGAYDHQGHRFVACRIDPAALGRLARDFWGLYNWAFLPEDL